MKRQPRTIVLCFDGTSSEYGANNTNVVKFYALLKKDKVDEQICYYQAGVGTYFQPGVVSPAIRFFATSLDQAIAWYLSAHVIDGYRFLMQNYNTGDKVCMFGFSRGAYTARALAGMLYKVGLLSKDNEAQIPFAYKLYKSEDPTSTALARGFKQTFCRPVPIQFVGVWDTVASVGLFTRRTLPFVTINTTIKTFRHALALDERRAKFRASYYLRPMPPNPPSHAETFVAGFRERMAQLISGDGRRFHRMVEALSRRKPRIGEKEQDGDSIFATNAKEVWFAGGHADVGGGASPDTDEYALSNIPLRWMVQEVMKAQCGIQFEQSALSRWNIPMAIADIFTRNTGRVTQTTIPEFVQATSQPESEQEAENPGMEVQEGGEQEDRDEPDVVGERDDRDVEQPINDRLRTKRLWWCLEVIPTKYTWQSSTTNRWVSEWSIHVGNGRGVPDNPLFHESVKRRMKKEHLNYVPRARYKPGNETYVH